MLERALDYDEYLTRASRSNTGTLYIIPAVSLDWRSHEEKIMWNIMKKYECMAIGCAPAGVSFLSSHSLNSQNQNKTKNEQVPALLRSGCMTGVVVAMVEKFTFIEPVYDGQLLHASRFLPIGGSHISTKLRRHLEGRGYGLPEDVVEDMKKKHCIVARDRSHARNLPVSKYILDEKTTIKLSG